ncbi:MAG TPA: AtpZ/AtpI family protein [Acidimicrobiia bacterium]
MSDHPENRRRNGSASVVGEWSAGGDFLGSILAGLLIGFLADKALGTDPWLTVVMIIAGVAVGFWRMMESARQINPEARTLPRPAGATDPTGDGET